MHSVIQFYRKVYEQELSQSKRLHLQSSRMQKRIFPFAEEQLLNDEFPMLPISDKEGEEILTLLELKGSDVQLKYYSGLRLSRFRSLNEHETSRAYPLFSYEGEIIQNKHGYFLQVDKSSIQPIKSNFPGAVSNHPEFQKLLLHEVIELSFFSKLSAIIAECEPESDHDELVMYPKLWQLKKVNRYFKKPFEEGDKYVPAGVIGIVEKENESYTTLDELRILQSTNTYSAPIRSLFGQEVSTNPQKRGIICEELNSSQLMAIDNSNDHPISVVSGPPGTGKSFTIANLAAEKVSKGHSVLITSKNKEALQVIEEKLRKQLELPDLTINTTRDKQFMGVKKRLDYLLGRHYKPKKWEFSEIENMYDAYQKNFDKHQVEEEKLLKSLELEKNLIGEYFGKGYAAKSSQEFKDRMIKQRSKVVVPLWESLDHYYGGIRELRKESRHLIKQVNRYLIDRNIQINRKKLRDYQSFLRGSIHNKKEREELVDFQVVLKAFPVWLVTANQISKALAYDKEMFDVLIIDEASQCDIPSLLPLLQRAKRCVVVGDTNQLNHISFLSKAFESSARREVEKSFRHLCAHRDHSLLDLALEHIDPQAFVQLNEHFRSQLPIISFSNRAFYDERLNIMTKRPISSNKHVEFRKCRGKRLGGVNRLEIDKIVGIIRTIVDREQDLDPSLRTTIGILSPFRKQTDAIYRAMVDNFTYEEIGAHHIMIGTAFSFQGNEREVMFISLSLDEKSVGGSYTFMNRKDVFNVSVTRARSRQYIMYSFDPKGLNPRSTLAEFFRHYEDSSLIDEGVSTKDEFCHEVIAELDKKKCQSWTKFEISGVQIDLLAKKGESYFGIDLIGFPGELEDYFTLERYKLLERCGVPLFPLPYALWKANREKCLEALSHFF